MKKFALLLLISFLCVYITGCSSKDSDSLTSETFVSSDEPSQIVIEYYADSTLYLTSTSTYEDGNLTEFSAQYSDVYDESLSFVTINTYDEYGFLTEYVSTYGDDTEKSGSYENTYDDDGNLIEIRQSTTYTYAFEYDEEGRFTSLNVDWHTMDMEVGMELSYDDDGNATSIEVSVVGYSSTTSEITLTYDSEGRVKSYAAEGMGLTEEDQIYTQLLLADLIEYSHLWDDDLLYNTFCSDISYYDYDFSAEFTYDDAGNIATEDVDENGSTYTLTYTNEYDDEGHLTQTTATFDDDEGEYLVISYTY